MVHSREGSMEKVVVRSVAGFFTLHYGMQTEVDGSSQCHTREIMTPRDASPVRNSH